MADDSSGGSGIFDNGHSIAVFILFVIFLFYVLGTVGGDDSRFAFFKNLTGGAGETEEQESPEQETVSDGRVFVMGQKVVSAKNLNVRQTPGGQIIGQQRRGETGEIIEGPITAYGLEWLRIDFEKTPDGWVDKSEISKHIAFHKTIGFFPKLMSFLKAMMIIFGFILFFVFIWLLSRFRKLNKTNLEKKKLKKSGDVIYTPKNVAEKREKDFIKSQKFAENQMSVQNQKGVENQTSFGNQTGAGDLPVPNLPTGPAPLYEKRENKRWQNIQSLISSHNSSDWRQAIIECDIILDEMITKMGYQGDSIGDKLKKVEESDFLTLNQAWEAHKIRNRIAHRGSEYILNKNEAEKTVKLYEEVFKEFFYI